MYDDSWYGYLPESNKKEDAISTSHDKKPDRKQSLLKEPDGIPFDSDSIASLSVSSPESTSLSYPEPIPSQIKKSKSYGDFYEAKTSSLQDGAGSKRNKYTTEIPSTIEISPDPFEGFEDELLKNNLEDYKLYLDNLELSERHLERMIIDTTSALTHLETLSKSFQSIDSETTAFQAQCEKLLTEEKSLVDLTDEVSTALQYYSYLEPLTRRLNAVGAARIVTSEDFLDMLMNINSCIDFMDKHPSYRDSFTFKARYISLLDKSLNLVLRSFTSAFKDVTDEVTKELRSKENNETSEYILLYGKFQPIQARLGIQIQRLLTTTDFAFGKKGDKSDIAPYAPRYHELWSQIADVYIRSRDFVTLVVTKNLKNFITIEKPETEFQAFARHAVRYVLDICQNEQTLILRNFQGGPLLIEYETTLGLGKNSNYATRLEENVLIHLKTLHSHISPYLDNVNQKNICGLVEWLETMYLTTTDDNDIETSRIDRTSIAYTYLSKFLWKSLDESFLKAAMEIEHYKPSQNDINLNELSIQKATPGLHDEGARAKHDTLNHYLVSTAYPTVKTAVNLLILYNDGFADRPRNSDVSYEIVHQTTKSLQMAATMIKRNFCIMDAQLFLIKNLMLIENLFMTNEIPDSVRQAAEFDFSPIWLTISELQDQRQLFNPLALISPLIRGKLLPTVVDRVLDAKKEMENVLIQQMNAFTKTWQVRLKDENEQKRKKAESELEELLNRVLEDEITRAAIWKMIRAESIT